MTARPASPCQDPEYADRISPKEMLVNEEKCYIYPKLFEGLEEGHALPVVAQYWDQIRLDLR